MSRKSQTDDTGNMPERDGGDRDRRLPTDAPVKLPDPDRRPDDPVVPMEKFPGRDEVDAPIVDPDGPPRNPNVPDLER
ncbi:MAG: hypothetical protein ACT4N2_01450 [Hyphomicrobium sp.]